MFFWCWLSTPPPPQVKLASMQALTYTNSSILSSRICTVVRFTLRYMINIGLTFVFALRYGLNFPFLNKCISNFQLYLFFNWIPFAPVSKINFPYVWVYFCTINSLSLTHLSLFVSTFVSLINVTLKEILKLGNIGSQNLFFFKVILTIPTSLYFHMSYRMLLSGKKSTGILIWITLNL